MVETKCLQCKTTIFSYKSANRKFCSHSCSAKFNAKTRKKRFPDRSCNVCGGPINRNRNNPYCSISCFHESKYLEWERIYLSGNFSHSKYLRKFVIRRDGYKCNECDIFEWNGKEIVLELEHKDGDSSNNDPENLELLCPNCHSQTPTYKGKNKGSGRQSRRNRYANSKSS